MRCSVNINVKLLKNANMNTWKKFMSTNRWKLWPVRICHVMETTEEKESAGWSGARRSSSQGSVSDGDNNGEDDGDADKGGVAEPLPSKRLSLWMPV